jgi:peroxiredoxin
MGGISNRTLYIVAALVIVTGLTLTALSKPRRTRFGSEESAAPVSAGDKAAEFKLEALDGHVVSLESLRGKVVFLNLWATWCGPCRQEMPSMETLYDDFRNNHDFVMLAVSQDTKGRAVVEPYVEKNGYHFTILLDPENKVGASYDLSGVPETFIIDRDGRIVAHHMGAFDWSRPDVKEALQQLLDSKDSKSVRKQPDATHGVQSTAPSA